VNLLLSQIFPYAPILTKVILHLRGFDEKLDSTCFVESWFSTLKNAEYKGDLRLWLPLFLRRQYDVVKSKKCELLLVV